MDLYWPGFIIWDRLNYGLGLLGLLDLDLAVLRMGDCEGPFDRPVKDIVAYEVYGLGDYPP